MGPMPVGSLSPESPKTRSHSACGHCEQGHVSSPEPSRVSRRLGHLTTCLRLAPGSHGPPSLDRVSLHRREEVTGQPAGLKVVNRSHLSERSRALAARSDPGKANPKQNCSGWSLPAESGGGGGSQDIPGILTQSQQRVRNSARDQPPGQKELRLASLESEKQPGLPALRPRHRPKAFGVGSSGRISTAKPKVI